MPTKRAETFFRVAGFESGQPWIVLEPWKGDQLDMFQSSTIGFDLPPGTTYDEAQQVADYLQRHLIHVTETKAH